MQKTLQLVDILDRFLNNVKFNTLQNLAVKRMFKLFITRCKGELRVYFYTIANSYGFLSLNFTTDLKPDSRAISYALSIPKPIRSA